MGDLFRESIDRQFTFQSISRISPVYIKPLQDQFIGD